MYKWVTFALIGTLISSIGVILLKYIDSSKYDNHIFLLVSFILVGLIALLFLMYDNKYRNKIYEKCDKTLLACAIIFALVITVGNIIVQYAISISPNISYTHIIINLNIVVTILASYFLFNESINFECFIGILITLAGVTIIILNYDKK